MLQNRSLSAQVLVGAAAVMVVLSMTKVVLVGAIVFALFAALFAAGAMLTARGRVAGPIMALVPSLILIVAEGQMLLAHGVLPSAYSPISDFLIVVLGTPVALVCLISAIVVLAQTRQRSRVVRGVGA